MSPSRFGADEIPEWVRQFTLHDSRVGESRWASALLAEFGRQVRHVTRSYPDAWFCTGRKDDEAVLDLANRVFTTCARVEKGRFPFSGRTPFVAYVAERFDGRTIRYHSFYAKLSITRELMRDDYARNLVRDPVLRWRADLYAAVRDVVRQHATEERQGRGLPPRYSVAASGVRVLRSPEWVEARLRSAGERSVESIVLTALREAGPLSCSRLTQLAEAVLGTPADNEAPEPVVPAQAALQVAVRRAVLQAWNTLSVDDQHLLSAIVRGVSYDELVASDPRFAHKVAVTRAVTRCGRVFLDAITSEAEGTAVPMEGIRPKDLVELAMEVLVEFVPLDVVPASGPFGEDGEG